MKKILEIKGDDWLKGYSTQAGLALGGLFRTASNFNPFELTGFLQPSLQATELTAPSTNPIKIITNFNVAGTGYFYGHSNTKLYEYLANSPYTQTDRTSSIDVSKGVAGAIIWKGKYIYAQYDASSGTNIYSNSLPAGSNTLIYSDKSYTPNMDVRHMCVGPDGNLYVGDASQPTTGTAGGVIRLRSATGIDGDTTAFNIDYGFMTRAIYSDGKNLVILADNNVIANDCTTAIRTVGDYRCRVYFWDTLKGEADVIWDIKDSYLIGGGFLDGKVYIFGYNGIYVCNLVTSPKMIWDFRGNSSITARPTTPYEIITGSQDIYWADGGTNGSNIYALRDQTMYQPYTTHSTTANHTAILKIGDTIIAATSTPKLFIHNVGSTRSGSVVQTANQSLSQPYSYGFTKVTLKSPLSSGQEVVCNVINSNGSIITTGPTKTYNVDGAKKVLTFPLSPTSGSVNQFEDLSVAVTSIGGAVVERIAVYAEPIDDFIQQ